MDSINMYYCLDQDNSDRNVFLFVYTRTQESLGLKSILCLHAENGRNSKLSSHWTLVFLEKNYHRFRRTCKYIV